IGMASPVSVGPGVNARAKMCPSFTKTRTPPFAVAPNATCASGRSSVASGAAVSPGGPGSAFSGAAGCAVWPGGVFEVGLSLELHESRSEKTAVARNGLRPIENGPYCRRERSTTLQPPRVAQYSRSLLAARVVARGIDVPAHGLRRRLEGFLEQ